VLPIRSYLQRPLIRDVAIVATGAATAQIVSFLFIPVITRLYGPEAYGLQGVFFALVGFLSTFAALNYPGAIVLPRSNAEAISLCRLSIWLGLAIALTTALVFFLFGGRLLYVLNAESVANYIYLIPIMMLINVFVAVMRAWLSRNKAFRIYAKFQVITAFIQGFSKSSAGLYYPFAAVLIVTNVACTFLGVILTYVGWRSFARKSSKLTLPAVSASPMKEMAVKYQDFATLRTPQVVINALSQNLPVLILSSFSGAGAAGQYALAFAALALPSNITGNSISSVFYPRISEVVRDGQDAQNLIIKATAAMAGLAFIPFLLIALTGPWLFTLVFGADWGTAGEFAQWLSLWLFFQFITKPAITAIPALNIQRGLLIYELFSTAIKVIALWIGFAVYGSAIIAVALFSIVGAIAYLCLILWVIVKSGSKISLTPS